VFAIDGGAFGSGTRNVHYFAPDSLEWEDLEGGYSQFVQWCFTHDLEGFYEGYRWPGWREDVARISCDQGFSIVPPLWTKEGKDLARQDRAAVPMRELWSMQLSFRRQLGPRPPEPGG
jgi:hypothetical protein